MDVAQVDTQMTQVMARLTNPVPKWNGTIGLNLEGNDVRAIFSAQIPNADPPPEYPPVVISENEHSESDIEGKDKDIETGTELIQSPCCTVTHNKSF